MSVKLTDSDLIELLYQDKSGPVLVSPEVMSLYDCGCKELGLDIRFTPGIDLAPEEAVTQWSMPEHYQNLDLDLFFAEKISTVEEAERVVLELQLFQERNLTHMLRFMIYMVQVMKDNKIVWGVGRGSSVSSFLLYLVGLHQINPIKYNLGIEEFIR